ncbi:serine hydrolase domain-containing protein [Jeongeupia chitinilytica]|uniref:Serine hydrolase n=1 Tax=Jeongeupia chitinilytica TaxID=1041641 RepID=A0ABQ3GYR0_9NEIS|nr:serine hydrolase [Jeongeupia chitinilytica]GHD56606.1 serine hydrolase [Jeongeupia chitinilytica]
MSVQQESPIHLAPVQISPREAGFDPVKLDDLDRHFQRLIANGKLQGASYLLARRGKVFAHRSMGQLREDPVAGAFKPDSLRCVYSITKLVAAIAAMQLVEQGKLCLETFACALIDEMQNPKHNQIQLWHLLTHCSGLPADPGFYNEPYPHEWLSSRVKDNWITAALTGPTEYEPGTRSSYSSVGYAILGEIIARVSGQTFEAYVEEHILKPLGMKDSCFIVPESRFDEVCLNNAWQYERLLLRTPPHGIPQAAGGMYSTLADLYRLGQMMLNKGAFDGVRILSRKSVETMTRNWLPPNTESYYWGNKLKAFEHGLGVQTYSNFGLVSPGTYAHEGAWHSALFIDPQEELVVVYMVPNNPGWSQEAVIAPRGIIWSGLL